MVFDKKIIIFCISLILTMQFFVFGVLAQYDVTATVDSSYIQGATVTISGTTLGGVEGDVVSFTDTCGTLSADSTTIAADGTYSVAETGITTTSGTCTITATFHDASANVDYVVSVPPQNSGSGSSPPQTTNTPKTIWKKLPLFFQI
jgi:hypothetical protein